MKQFYYFSDCKLLLLKGRDQQWIKAIDINTNVYVPTFSQTDSLTSGTQSHTNKNINDK